MPSSSNSTTPVPPRSASPGCRSLRRSISATRSRSAAASGPGPTPASMCPSSETTLPLFLIDSNDNVISGTIIDRPSGGRDSLQTYPAGSTEWFSTPTATRDAGQQPVAHRGHRHQRDHVRHALEAAVSGEFIELYNRGGSTVDLSGWDFADGMSISPSLPGPRSPPVATWLVVVADSCLHVGDLRRYPDGRQFHRASSPTAVNWCASRTPSATSPTRCTTCPAAIGPNSRMATAPAWSCVTPAWTTASPPPGRTAMRVPRAR